MQDYKFVLMPHKGTPEVDTLVIGENGQLGMVESVSINGFVKATNGISGIIREYYSVVPIRNTQIPVIGEQMYDFAQEELFTVDEENFKYAHRRFCFNAGIPLNKFAKNDLIGFYQLVAKGAFGTIESPGTMLMIGTLNSLNMSEKTF